MSSSMNRAPSDFVRLREIDKKEERYDENIQALLEENGLYRKRLIKGPNSLMRAVSDALYFNTNQANEIQQSLLTFLTQLIASDKLTARLNNFQVNSSLLKDFANNPQLSGFEKTNLELVSLFFNVRVVLYTMNEDHYLTATIFNNNYPNTIELLRTKTSHYDTIFSKSFIKNAGICQNVVLSILDKVLNGRSSPVKNINGDEYVNITYESSLAKNNANKELNQPDQFRITRGQHKKSLSDNFNTNFDTMEEQQMKFYDAFMNAAPADDFLKNIQTRKDTRKDTAESGFSINANFDFIDEQNLDPPFQGQAFAIKNYPISSGGLSPRGLTGIELDSPMPSFSKAKFANHPNNVHFNENLSLLEIERLEKSINTATTVDPKQMNSSPYYRNVSPPGLIPMKFSQQRSFTETIPPHSDFLSPSPIMVRDNSLQASSPTYPFSNNSPQKRGVAPFGQQQQQQQNFSQGMGNEKPLFSPQPMGNQRQYPDSQIQAFAPQSQTLNSQSQNFSMHPQQQQHPQQLNSIYMKRAATAGTSLALQSPQIQTDEYGMSPQGMGYEQGGMSYDNSPGFDPSIDFEQAMMYGQGYNATNNNGGQREKKKPIILDESQERYFGRLKFFDENKKYGFIVMDDDGSDIFVHYDDLLKANITKDLLRTARLGNVIRLNFGCMDYIGKYNRSRKAIDIQLVM